MKSLPMQETALTNFHPAVQRWFFRTLGSPTPIQVEAWNALSENRHALISAPTGEGKTLAGFLAIIDDLVKRAVAGENIRRSRILYISPLKALSNDIEKNLQIPLRGIRHELEKEGIDIDEIHAMVRTGDSTASERAKLVRLKPQIVVTTPESLYLLLTSASGRALLETIETVIVDEIHALVSNRRGAHLALSLERLEAIRLQAAKEKGDLSRYARMRRIGISATVRPLERVAEYLVGNEPIALCSDKKQRPFDIRMLMPTAGLSAVMSGENWDEVYRSLADEIQKRRTTLIFVNNRRLCERLARHLSELLGQNLVASHHGSLSHAQRHRAEQMLKAGDLKVMIATSSLELGLDIGSIDLVVQISSPRSIHAFIQRAGRSEHNKHGTSRALLIPLSRDDLVECIALIRSLRAGELEEVSLCVPALDVLAQQIIAEVSMRDYSVAELFSLFTGAYAYRNLALDKFRQLLQMLNDGYSLRFGRKARYIFYDKSSDHLHARPGTRIYAALNGGAIPENFEYEVVDEKEQVFVGTVHEDFAIESIQGDVFQLGNRMWQITSVRGNRVSVFHAPDKHPTIPFWIVDVPGRSDALSKAVSSLNESFLAAPDLERFVSASQRETGLTEAEMRAAAEYLRESREALKALPTHHTVILERFFDEVNNCHIVLHSPFGTQINRAWGLALRKRFCRQFNFELQAAANDSAIILSLSHTHSFILDEVFTYLSSKSARDVLIQALLDAPMFEIRWRWNASRALAILRRNSRGKTPAQWQKSNAQDLIALLFPDQIACAENLSGPREIPDHPLVEQTMYDCLNEAMDVEGFLRVLRGLESGEIRTLTVDSAQPSQLAHEIINARPYAFLDDAPLEERRTRAVRTNFEEREGDTISDATLAAVQAETLYPARNAYELYDRITQFAIVPEAEAAKLGFATGLADLAASEKIIHYRLPFQPTAIAVGSYFISADKLDLVQSAYSTAESNEIADQRRYSAIEAIVLSHLELLGPLSIRKISERLALEESTVTLALLALENSGSVFQFERRGEKMFVERAYYQRLLHFDRRPRDRQYRVSAEQYLKFLQVWQHAAGEALSGSASLRKILLQLQGVALSQQDWVEALKLRLTDFSERMLEELFLTGEFFWWRPVSSESKLKTITPKTRYMILSRELWYRIAEPFGTKSLSTLSADAKRIYEYLDKNGASFMGDIHAQGKFFSEQTLRGMRELVARGLVTSDQFFALRRLSMSKRRVSPRMNSWANTPFPPGRFALMRFPDAIDESDRMIAVAEMQLARQGVIYRYAAEKDFFKVPWPQFVRTLRLMEMRGLIRGGRFIEGLWGEQFAEPQALGLLAGMEKASLYKEISFADPVSQVSRLMERLGVLPPVRKQLLA
ncbi:MAG: DEAD/DEAH box helicase [Turneriella sp.]